MNSRLRIEEHGLSHKGQVRQANEDNFGYAETDRGGIFVVCDGMGGHKGGARASAIATKSILEFLTQEPVQDPPHAIAQAIQFANEQIYATAVNDPDLRGMGTTCVVAYAEDQVFWLGHVGDSRIYIYSEDKLHRLTRDHSFVQNLVDQGVINDEEAEQHPRKNELLKALGTRPSVEPEVTEQAICPAAGDVLLLCSDGLFGMTGDKALEELLAAGKPMSETAQAMIDAANEAGGYDNITVYLVKVLESQHRVSRYSAIVPLHLDSSLEETRAEEMEVPDSAQEPHRPWKKLVIGGVGVLALLALLAYFFLPGSVPPKEEVERYLIADEVRLREVGGEHERRTFKARFGERMVVSDTLGKDSFLVRVGERQAGIHGKYLCVKSEFKKLKGLLQGQSMRLLPHSYQKRSLLDFVEQEKMMVAMSKADFDSVYPGEEREKGLWRIVGEGKETSGKGVVAEEGLEKGEWEEGEKQNWAVIFKTDSGPAGRKLAVFKFDAPTQSGKLIGSVDLREYEGYRMEVMGFEALYKKYAKNNVETWKKIVKEIPAWKGKKPGSDLSGMRKTLVLRNFSQEDSTPILVIVDGKRLLHYPLD